MTKRPKEWGILCRETVCFPDDSVLFFRREYDIIIYKKADLLGMGKNKHWVLLANDKDTTLLRNRIISYMGTELELAYTPKMLPVDVVMNGEYLGSYYLSEQVRVGDTRVDIDELTDKDNDEPEITGGYLLSLSPYPDAPEENIFYTEKNVGFGFENPEFYSDDPTDELGTAAQKAYISNYLQETENAVYSGNVSEYMDLQSAADYWWIQEFSLNVDAFRTDSTYLYKPRGDKLYWGPLWDFDLSLGKSRGETFGFNQSKMPWLDYLRENNEDFQQLLRERWTVLDGIIVPITFFALRIIGYQGAWISRVVSMLGLSVLAVIYIYLNKQGKSFRDKMLLLPDSFGISPDH